MVLIRRGFVEYARRLLFPYENHCTNSPHLQTILPTGIVENEKDLMPGDEKALIAYPYPQSISEENAIKFILISTSEYCPCMWQRDDGSVALVQTWSTKFNPKFKKEFTITSTNPDPNVFSEQAVAEFSQACKSLFEINIMDPLPTPILYCLRATTNNNKVYVGTPAELLELLRTNPIVVSEMNIKELTETGFIAGTIDGKGKTDIKAFTMPTEEVNYALYTKEGWDVMACVTPLDQFLKDRTFL